MESSSQAGFNALELIVAMTVAAVVLAAGVPALQNYGYKLRMKTAMDALKTDLNLARGRAISHNVQTVVCPADDTGDCSGSSDWEHGWIVFADLDNDRHRQAGETLLKSAGAVEFLRISSSDSRSFVRYYPNGTAPGTNLGISFCDRRGPAHAGRIVVSNTGRIRVDMEGIESGENCP